MDLNCFDDVLVLLEERNMTRAAARRNITQPAFSRRIRSFEDWLGTPILERHANRIEISAALLANEEELRAMVANLREMRTRFTNFAPGRSSITIAAQHALTVSTLPDMTLRARAAFPNLDFRPRAGNLHDCVTRFLRGDASMLLCYEARSIPPLEFGTGVVRGHWGTDYLVPVVGGALRYTVKDTGWIPDDTPAIPYPEGSYFGDVLSRENRQFGTPGSSLGPVCVTAFSSGTKELVLHGIGVGWVPFSMVHREIASGELISLAYRYGREPLNIALFTDKTSAASLDLLSFWTR
ncbi:LysR family transcriptional regulator [Pseudaestuariivita atlantica]|uniref:LysR family transcriptional regulator n=1 Tax=Pseudaestuariivita atlantica TaxID=1317121 RepID=A0A0L1JLP8_9RHOB|nr:LysR family transcriptional regulator [Pseudaestuariivita atlantica]KNG92679.1 LysR family transcriptional regulator [Pseudaestuariivita atlantica]